MNLRVIFYYLFFSLLAASACSQMVFRATVKDNTDSIPLPLVTVTNLSTSETKLTNQTGSLFIKAGFNDTLIVSAVGYFFLKIALKPSLFISEPVIYLNKNYTSLNEVKIYADTYREDSINFRNEYAHVFKRKKTRLLNRIHAEPAFGLKFSPVTYFSRKEKSRRRLLKNLKTQEQQAYISYRFSAYKIGRYTGLKEDSLHIFLLRYRPSYSFCVKSSEMDMLFYINDCLKKFKYPPE